MLDDFRTYQKVIAIAMPPPAPLAALAIWRR
jgi:hypothetical protein